MGEYKYIYGPVASWRLGRSLGIDPVSARQKVCTFDCIYCQVGKTKIFSDERKIYAPTAEIIKELVSLPPLKVDYITFSGAGEPTLAENLGQLIEEIKKIRSEKIAILTNSSLMDREDVQKDLLLADFVSAKLDACSEKLFSEINQPMRAIRCETVVKALKEFRAQYKGALALQIMFVANNKTCAEKISRIAKEIDPDEIELNTPLRPCDVKPLSVEELKEIESRFLRNCGETVKIVNVYKRRGKA